MDEIDILRRRVEELEAARAADARAQDALRGSPLSPAGSFFDGIALELARAAGAEVAFVGELLNDGRRVRAVGMAAENRVVPSFEYALDGTPCEKVVGGDLCAYPTGVRKLFPKDVLLQEMGIDGYCGVPLFDSRRRPIGLIVVLARRPLTDLPGVESLLRLAAVRASAELERVRTETLHKGLFESRLFGIAYCAEDGRVFEINEVLLEMLGRTREDFVGGSVLWTRITPPEFAPLDAVAVEELRTTGVLRPYEKELLKSDGTRVPVLVGGSRLTLSPLTGVAFVLDRTALRTSDQLSRQIIASLREGLVVHDRALRYVHFNPAMEAITGLAAKDVLGKHPLEVFPTLREMGIYQSLERALAGESTTSPVVPYPGRSGAPRWASASMSPLRDLSGAVTGVVGVVRDVTELKQAEDALRSSEALLSEALKRTQDRVIQLEEQVQSRSTFEGLVGKSPGMQEIYRRLRLAAESDVTVLLTGESGTGKELAAASVHALSHRRGRPFVAVNCSAIPEGVLESELFGHVKGAFTGATRDKVGLFQAAEGGTLFLDEVGDMSPVLQVKVLRALQEREIRRVGDDRTIKVNVRLVTATNRDLAGLIADGSLREDFYYRIRVFEIHLPPLRERREDIPLLVEYFMREFSKSLGKPVEGLTSDAMRRLAGYDWPGNVRELRNAIEHAFVTLRGTTLRLQDLPFDLRGAPTARPDTRAWKARNADEERERDRIVEELRRCGGNRTRAAKQLGISRVTLWNKINRYGIRV
jgi:two-component system response regulator HydG